VGDALSLERMRDPEGLPQVSWLTLRPQCWHCPRAAARQLWDDCGVGGLFVVFCAAVGHAE
jgi:hypothetical protein